MSTPGTDWAAWAEASTAFPALDSTALRLVNLIYLAIFFFALLLVKWFYELNLRTLNALRSSEYREKEYMSLNRLLTTQDNKAVAISFASYALGICIVLSGSFDSLNLLPLADAVVAGLAFLAVGLVLVPLAKMIDTTALLFFVPSAHDSLVYDTNFAMALLDSSSFIGSAIMLRSALVGPQREDLGIAVAKVVVFWCIQRVLFSVVTVARQLGCSSLRAAGEPFPPSSSSPKSVAIHVNVAEGGAGTSGQAEPVVVAEPEIGLGYQFAIVRRAMTTKDAILSADPHSGMVLAADIIAAAVVTTAPAFVSYSLLSLVTWMVFGMVLQGILHVALDSAVFRGARERFASSREVFGAVVVDVGCTLCVAIFVSHQFREVYALPGQSSDISPGFAEFGDLVVGVWASSSGLVQIVLFSVVLVVYLYVARATFSLEYVIYDYLKRKAAPRLQLITTPALAVSYTGYALAHALIFTGVVDCIAVSVTDQLLNLVLWCALGSGALVVSQLSSNFFLLRGIVNAVELRRNNMAVALVDMGHSIAAGLIIQASVSGDSDSIAGGVASFAIFYLASQVLFVGFSLLYQIATKYDDLQTFRDNNVAAALGHALSQIALGLMLSAPITKTSSLAIFAVQAVLSVVILLLSRIFVDKVLLPTHALDSEISNDVNWGAALVEGAFAIGIAIFVDALLPQLGAVSCNQVFAVSYA